LRRWLLKQSEGEKIQKRRAKELAKLKPIFHSDQVDENLGHMIRADRAYQIKAAREQFKSEEEYQKWKATLKDNSADLIKDVSASMATNESILLMKFVDQSEALARALISKGNSPPPNDLKALERLLAAPENRELVQDWLERLKNSEFPIQMTEKQAKSYLLGKLYPKAYEEYQTREKKRQEILAQLKPVISTTGAQNGSLQEVHFGESAASFDWENARLDLLAPDMDILRIDEAPEGRKWTDKTLKAEGYHMTQAKFQHLLKEYGKLDANHGLNQVGTGSSWANIS